ncbi:SAC3 family protein C isoform X2 [Gossypium arboreum]|uniref:SAC3 family protein C isoform X2 n=1 Tax=Gossypium arboreum TaxID=29729 RepID=UPI00081955CD|nr:SAC3 family protein C isoform X2 [Gossypium arboreum]
MDDSTRRLQQRRNQPSFSSSSSTGPTRFRSQNFSTNPTKTTQSSNFVPRSNSTTATTPNNTRNPGHIRNRKSETYAGINQQQEEQEAREDVGSIIGTCPFMCPDGERAQRERLRDLAVFERLHGDPRKTSPSLAVKKFCRTISVKHVQASDVRPLAVLEDTLNYLLNLLDSSEHPFEVVHDFIFDRTRSIRQDLSMQHIVNDRAICMYEKMVKFHVISHQRLRNCTSSSISSLQYLNMEQLTKALASLYVLYEANRNNNFVYENEANRNNNFVYENEAQFHSFYVLLHLDSKNQQMESLSYWFRNVPSPVMKSKEMHFARQVLRFYRMGNYKRFLCTVSTESSYLQYCIIEPHVNEVRALAISYINNCCYKLHPYPLEQLSKLLMMKELDVESLCHACGLEISSDDGENKSLPMKQTTFSIPKGSLQSYELVGLQQ